MNTITGMARDEIVGAIIRTLRTKLDVPAHRGVTEGTRLQDELGLDSVSLLDLVVELELGCGLSVPEDALLKDAFFSVSTLASALAGAGAPPPATPVPEFQDIKVHCFVSCLCECVKACDFTDHRPFYFGVWDSEIVTDARCRITNHAEGISHDFFREWFRRLYGVEVVAWYDEAATRTANLKGLSALLDARKPGRNIMVMLDLFRLPERENRFTKDPFPHYVMLERTSDPETIFMRDPDFRWEGPLPVARVLQAIDSPAVSGGYYFDSDTLRPVPRREIDAYFRASMIPDRNPLTDAIRRSVEAHLSGASSSGERLVLADLESAVLDIPLLAIRKYAYEHGFAFFMRESGWDESEFERWCEVIANLVQGYTRLQYRIIKLARGVDDALLEEIHALLDEQDTLETGIKSRLSELHAQWCRSALSPTS